MSICKSGIYLIKNNTENKIYIGSATNLSSRKSAHLRTLRNNCHRNNHLQRAWNKYGESSFSFQILLICDKANLILYEQRVIDYFAGILGFRQLYNISLIAGSALGRKHTKETKEKIGKANKKNKGRRGKKWSPETRQKMEIVISNRKPRSGFSMSEEAKRKISDSLKGHEVSQTTRVKISKSGLGRKHSEETKIKMSKNNSRHLGGKHLSEETKAKISISKKGQIPWIAGRKHTIESIQKMKEAKRIRRESKDVMEGRYAD